MSEDKPVLAYGWNCMKGQQVVHTNRRTFAEEYFARRAADNHRKQHKECRPSRGRQVIVVPIYGNVKE